MSTTPVVLDLGTGYLKAGLSSRQIPDFVLQNTVGRPILRSDESFSKAKLKDIMVCDETYPVRQYLDLTLPVEHGIVKNWEDEALVLDYVFKEKLKIRNEDHPLLITEAPLNPKDNRKKMCEIFFEQFNFPRLQVCPQALLVLYAQGLMTGVVVDSGDGVTHIMPIAENYILSHLTGRMDISGRDVTEQLVKLLTLRGYTFHKTSDFDVVREIKEQLCFISADIDVDRKIANETTTFVVPYKLNDGRIVKVSGERFEAPEILFQPDLIGLECKGLSDLLFDTIMKADINLRRNLFESIVVSGGTTMFPGLSERLQNDLKKSVLTKVLGGNSKSLESYKINVEDPPNRRYLVYLGATILANLTENKSQQWATKQDYNEIGVDRIIAKWGSAQ
ncbi:Actin family protein [Trichomonas vaginalis G3]|uniref:Actin family protein n=1 Tax=Trichomonas vaginalis (strain ATCC PRA-98 / G3) TaxID=412133 RepID=A2FH22_TRIV3|nr:actin 3 family [Trichomonas vaginalis G3]XP_001308722.1 actin 3 family [Trichomonas vaginalis G3]EAX95790.1 Actin family protein [Trichomonas vaginalis G3]EAX95792.1 Actin family protein [Trichomonas vaginalis G3]KAI5536538.1 actin 3 family [Trichomonas vaginalis G3]KAI5536540.1 actin 3 family [Trichomonas vaginalis G3]|eukprot:XP_001308720.1 Actin family protein [Trichomonas vaginalis G3]